MKRFLWRTAGAIEFKILTQNTHRPRNASIYCRRVNTRTRRRPLVGAWGRACRYGVLAGRVPSSRGLGCCLVGNLAAFDRIADAIGDVAFAANLSDRLTFCSASATFSANRPFGGKEAIEHLAAHVGRDLLFCADVFVENQSIAVFIRHVCVRMNFP